MCYIAPPSIGTHSGDSPGSSLVSQVLGLGNTLAVVGAKNLVGSAHYGKISVSGKIPLTEK